VKSDARAKLHVRDRHSGMPQESQDEGKSPPRRKGRLAELGPGWISAISALIAALVGVVGLLIARNAGDGGSNPPATTTQGETQEILAPAAVPSAVGLCDQQLQITVTGGGNPLLCDDGRVNVRAWRHYAELDPFVMRLDPDSTPTDVSRALCSDIERSATITSLETEAYLLAKAYYGWDFVLDPLDDFPAYC
jgi:hypothetical protein